VAGPPPGREAIWVVPEAAAGSGPADSALRRAALGRALGFGAIGLLADLDLLVGRHSQFTHSVGAVAFVLAMALLALRGRARWLLLAFAAGAAYASHPLLDWLGQDATPPRGITALWPFTHEYYLSHADIFWGISRQPWRPGVLWHNTLAVLREVGLLGPLALLVWWVRRRPVAPWQNLRSGAAADGQPLPRDMNRSARGESEDTR
jgi:inner membrane protein